MVESFKRCFSVNLNSYDQIGINLEINKVLLPVFIVFGLMMLVLTVSRDKMRTLVIQLMRHNALSEETACTLEELGVSENKQIKRLISNSNMIKNVVKRVDAKKYSYEEYKKLSKKERKEAEKIDFVTEKFYINEEQIDRARHIKEKYQLNEVRIIVGVVFLILIYIAIAASMPEILNSTNKLLKGQQLFT